MTHIDDFIDSPRDDEPCGEYAANWFSLFRRPEIEKLNRPTDGKLFTTFKGKRWRVMGCSRLGDVWLNVTEHHADYGYILRVDVDGCSAWSDKP